MRASAVIASRSTCLLSLIAFIASTMRSMYLSVLRRGWMSASPAKEVTQCSTAYTTSSSFSHSLHTDDTTSGPRLFLNTAASSALWSTRKKSVQSSVQSTSG